MQISNTPESIDHNSMLKSANLYNSIDPTEYEQLALKDSILLKNYQTNERRTFNVINTNLKNIDKIFLAPLASD